MRESLWTHILPTPLLHVISKPDNKRCFYKELLPWKVFIRNICHFCTFDIINTFLIKNFCKSQCRELMLIKYFKNCWRIIKINHMNKDTFNYKIGHKWLMCFVRRHARLVSVFDFWWWNNLWSDFTYLSAEHKLVQRPLLSWDTMDIKKKKKDTFTCVY